MDPLDAILHHDPLTREDLVLLLGLRQPADVARLRARAQAVTRAQVGDAVFYRGLIELSNICACDCH